MPDFFVVLIKINVALILFFFGYFFLLRRLTFYKINRYFLLGGILLSSVYPFIDFNLLFFGHEQLISPIIAIRPILTGEAGTFKFWLLLKAAFWTGAGFMVIKNVINFLSFYQIHKQSVPGKIGRYTVRILDAELSTFSFWRNIYINPELYQPKTLHTILAHEQVHITQLHTIDILFAEIMTIFYWFNPGIWYMRKAIKENLEFITDEQVLNNGIDKKTYQYSLINTASIVDVAGPVSNFNIMGIKRRIIMMNSKRSSKLQIIRYTILLPLLLLLFTVTLVRAEKTKSSIYKRFFPIIAEKSVAQPVAATSLNKAEGLVKVARRKKNRFIEVPAAVNAESDTLPALQWVRTVPLTASIRQTSSEQETQARQMILTPRVPAHDSTGAIIPLNIPGLRFKLTKSLLSNR